MSSMSTNKLFENLTECMEDYEYISIQIDRNKKFLIFRYNDEEDGELLSDGQPTVTAAISESKKYVELQRKANKAGEKLLQELKKTRSENK